MKKSRKPFIINGLRDFNVVETARLERATSCV